MSQLSDCFVELLANHTRALTVAVAVGRPLLEALNCPDEILQIPNIRVSLRYLLVPFFVAIVLLPGLVDWSWCWTVATLNLMRTDMGHDLSPRLQLPRIAVREVTQPRILLISHLLAPMPRQSTVCHRKRSLVTAHFFCESLLVVSENVS